MEIERKWLIENVPENIGAYPHEEIEQCYISTRDPVIRLRKYGESYFLTVKGKGKLVREEHEYEVDKDYYEALASKCEGLVIKKTRYRLPVASGKKEYTAEIDVFHAEYDGLMYAEVEFETKEEALSFKAPEWFGRDVTFERGYSNADLSKGTCNTCKA